MTNTAVMRPTTTDPAAVNPYETAAFSDGAGASDGGEEIDDGEAEGDGEDVDDGGGEDVDDGGGEDVDDGGDRGELTAEAGDGETVGGGLDGEAAGGIGAAVGDDAGDCATAEKTNTAAIRRIGVKDEAI